MQTMKCQATKVYLCENMEIDRKRCDADATVAKPESPSVRKPESPSDPPIVFNEHVYHLCAECAKAYDDYVNGEKRIYSDCVNGEKYVYEIIFDG